MVEFLTSIFFISKGQISLRYVEANVVKRKLGKEMNVGKSETLMYKFSQREMS